jgi:hypothetical protein
MNFNKKSLFLVENGIHHYSLTFQRDYNFLYSRNAFADEKRRYEARINQLEEELEEEQTNAELTDDKIKKLAINYEQILLDIATERSNNEKLEVNSTELFYRLIFFFI